MINPDIPENQLEPYLECPREPQIMRINPTSSARIEVDPVLDMNPMETTAYQIEYNTWLNRSKCVDNQLKALSAITRFINQTVAIRHYYLLHELSTVAQKLCTLKDQLAPTDTAREMEVVTEYKALTKYSKKEDIEH